MKKALTFYLIKSALHTLFIIIVGILIAQFFPNHQVIALITYLVVSFWFFRLFILTIFSRSVNKIQRHKEYIEPSLYSTIISIIEESNLSIQSKYLAIIQNTFMMNAKNTHLKTESEHDNTTVSKYDSINKIIADITAKSSSEQSSEEFYQLVLEEVTKLFIPCVRASFLTLNSENETLNFVATIGYENINTNNIHFMKHESLVYNAHTGFSSSPMIIRNYHKKVEEQLSHKTFRSIISSIPKAITSRLAIPIQANGEFYGVINIDQGDQIIIFEEFLSAYDQLGVLISILCENWELTQSSIKLSRYDKLTGLYNRSYFEQVFSKYQPKTLTKLTRYSLVLCDLNDLKLTNDNYGHIAGDQLLSHFSSHLSCIVSENDILARLGGDEFIIIFDQKDIHETEDIMNEFTQSLSKDPLMINGNEIKVSFAYGLASSPDDSMIYDILFKIADENMYIHKADIKGKHRD